MNNKIEVQYVVKTKSVYLTPAQLIRRWLCTDDFKSVSKKELLLQLTNHVPNEIWEVFAIDAAIATENFRTNDAHIYYADQICDGNLNAVEHIDHDMSILLDLLEGHYE
jgi:hypothetical protein